MNELEKIESIKETISNFDPNLITKFSKMKKLLQFEEAKSAQPNLTQDQICKKIGISTSSMQRIRKDVNMQSPYKYIIPAKKSNSKKKQGFQIEQKQPEIKINSNGSQKLIPQTKNKKK